MARHRSSSLTRTLNTMARDAARYRREAEAAERRRLREQERQQRERARQQALASKEAKVAYQQARQEEVEDQNGELFLYLKGLQNILQATLNHDDTIQFSALRDTRRFPPFDPPKDVVVPLPQPKEADFTQGIKSPGTLAKLFGAQAAHERALQEAQQRYRSAQVAWNDHESKRSAELGMLLASWEQERNAFGAKQAEQHAEIERFEQTYRAGEPEAVLAYNGMVLEESDYPDGASPTTSASPTPGSPRS